MQDTLKLIGRLKKASGPDRGLDALIAVATFHEPHGDDDLIYAKPVTKDDNCSPGTFWRKSRSGLSLQTAPAYTASLDAAMTLVPNGYCFGIENAGRFDRNPNTLAWVWPLNSDFDPDWRARNDGYRSAPDGHQAVGTPAIALCIAALKARAVLSAETKEKT